MSRERDSFAVFARGQAMTEFLVVCLALIPFFLAIPLLGKYMDIRHGAIQGARYSAWERTVWAPAGKTDVELEREVRNRLFTPIGTPLLASDRTQPLAAYNPLWRDSGGQPMLADFDAVKALLEGGASGETTPGLVYNSIVQTLVDLFNDVSGAFAKIGGVRPSRFEIDVHGMYSGTVTVAIVGQGTRGTPAPGLHWMAPGVPPIDLRVRSNVIVTDTWSASSPGRSGHYHCSEGEAARSELCQVAPLVLTNALSGWFRKLTQDGLGAVIPEFKGLDYGRIVANEAPKDRTP